MDNKKIRFIISAFVLSALMFTCARIPSHTGKSRQIVVLSKQPDPQLIESNIQIYQYLPQKEALFSFLCLPDTAIKTFKKNHSLFLYGSLDDEFIDLLLDDEAARTTRKDTATLFKLDDVWTKGQIVVVLAISEPAYIDFGIKKFSNVIAKIFEEHYYEIVKETYYRGIIDRSKSNTLSKFGVKIDMTKGWLIDSTYADQNFVFIHAHFPDRSIFFYKTQYPEKLSPSSVMDIRNELTKKYYNGDYLLKDFSQIDPIEFKDLRGIRVKGIWQNDSLVAGGPFISYFLKKGDSLYIIDGMLFNPGERKSDYYTVLEVMLNSFALQ